MDFFAHQDRARRNTRLLLVYLVLAVTLIVAMFYFPIAFFLRTQFGWSFWFYPKVLLTISAVVLLIVGGASIRKIIGLRAGGRAIAELLDAEPVAANTQNMAERRLLNVVEEMAIASGTPVPTVYLLRRERCINAFAAGFTPSNAAIGVTQGCLDTLTRDELQGAIAHEFSHILNGDMRLNMKLIGVVHGIQAIGLLGAGLMRAAASPSRRERRSSDSIAGEIISRIAMGQFGLCIYGIGLIGVFFARLIKAAVSRQREFLADAAAVQFTRTNWGLTGALKKIGGYEAGSFVRASHAEETSHMFFSNGLSYITLRSLATHPPLKERILRMDPEFDGSFTVIDLTKKPVHPPVSGPDAVTTTMVGTAALARSVNVENLINQIGNPSRNHLDCAAELKASIPPEVIEAAHDPQRAPTVIYGLLLDRQRQARAVQIRHLKQLKDPVVTRELPRLARALKELPTACRLPLLDLTLPALRQLSAEQYRIFQTTVRHLVKADQRTGLFEYVLQRVLRHHLKPHFTKVRPGAIQYYGIKPLVSDIEVLISALAHLGHYQTDEATRAWEMARQLLCLDINLLSRKDTKLKSIDRALDKLALASPLLKKRVLEACVVCIATDGKAKLKEAELLRAIADGLDCPVPPFLPGQEI